MFFTLSTTKDDRLPLHEKVGNWIFSHDAGWIQRDSCWQKGYSHRNIDHGNWAKISFVDDHLIIEHDRYRGFPLWWDQQKRQITNLLGTGQQIWSDQRIQLSEQGLLLTHHDILPLIDDEKIDLEKAADLICDNLVSKAKELSDLLPDLPRRLFLTGGIDTLTLLSVLRYTNSRFEIVDYEYVKYDIFLDKNLEQISSNHWGYKQIHHWTTPTMLLTGGCGDEFMFRGPATISMWAAWNDIDMMELLDKSTGYHVEYFKKQKNSNIFIEDWKNRAQIRKKYADESDLLRQLLNINANDYQHWHLGETITWTPFKDLEITKIVLSMDQESILRQVINAELNRTIIKKLYPKALLALSETKNIGSRANLHNVVL